MNQPKADKSYRTPKTTSKLTVIPFRFSLSHQERRLRDHGTRLRKRHLSIFGHHKQGKCENPQGQNFDLS
jgi:hypothetical protein